MRSADWALTVALVAAIEADAPLMALLVADGVYTGEAPADTPLDDGQSPPVKRGYVIVGSTAEQPAGSQFGREGHAGTVYLHIWGRTRADTGAIYTELARVLDGPLLQVDGHTMVEGALEKLLDKRDPPPDDAATQAVLRYTARTMEGA